MKWKKLLPILPALMLAGCATTSTTFTNLTPLQQPRNADNLYPVEVSLQTTQQSLNWNSLQPFVLVNNQLYPMHRTPLMNNRWEGFVPVPPGTNDVIYRYKFNYLYNHFGSAPKPGSVYSPQYELKITGQ
ncbi:MAG: hypothetical protein KGJ60_11605 [Verrucomicrobiota bacterium]|nr:hypothetical protein [Verrucomicrobiota bacterium]MDE3068182.1 hypothetical protein [Verrucomicrobiota bacterium]